VQLSNMDKLPSLRFPEFLGTLTTCRLGEITYSISSGRVKPSKSGNYIVYGSTGAIGKTETASHNGKYLLIARVGAHAGTINYVEGKFGVTDNTLVIDMHKSVDIKFIHSFLLKFVLARLLFGTGQPLITGGQLKSIKVQVPSLPEQQKIAAFLSIVDRKIQLLTRKKELLEQYKKGVMRKIFSQKIRFKDENGNDYPVWEEKRLGELAVINPKTKISPNTFIYIDLESVEKGRLIKEALIDLANAPSRAQRYLEKGDILFQTVRPYQKNNYLFNRNGDYVASTGYAQIRAKGDIDFLYQILHYQPLVNLIIRWSTGSNYPAVNPSDLATIQIKVPSNSEQKKVGLFLHKLDERIESVITQIAIAQQFKKGLLQQMFV